MIAPSKSIRVGNRHWVKNYQHRVIGPVCVRLIERSSAGRFWMSASISDTATGLPPAHVTRAGWTMPLDFLQQADLASSLRFVAAIRLVSASARLLTVEPR